MHSHTFKPQESHIVLAIELCYSRISILMIKNWMPFILNGWDQSIQKSNKWNFTCSTQGKSGDTGSRFLPITPWAIVAIAYEYLKKKKKAWNFSKDNKPH